MSYILCLGFKLNLYKKFPLIRVHLDDFFIDEFFIKCQNSDTNHNTPHSLSWIKYSKSYHKLNPKIKWNEKPKNLEYMLDKNIYFRFFELDSKFIDKTNDHTLKLEIINDDSNFTNGFLTHSTLVCLSIVHIVPKEVLKTCKDFCRIYERNLLKYKSLKIDSKNIKTFYIQKLQKFNILTNNFYNIYKDHKGIDWHIDKSIICKEQNQWTGGTGFFKFYFDLDTILPNFNNYSLDHLDIPFLESIATKYTQYENQ